MDIKKQLAELREKAPGKRLSEREFMTAPYQCSFPHLYEKAQNEKYPNTPTSYEVSFLVPKDDPFAKELINHIFELAAQKYGEDKDKWPEVWRKPVIDGDKKKDKYPEFAGHYIFKAKNYTDKPYVYDRSKPVPQLITDPREIYPGCVLRIRFETYYSKKFDSIGFSLRSVQKIADAEPFGGTSAPDNGECFANHDLEPQKNPSTGSNEDPFADFG